MRRNTRAFTFRLFFLYVAFLAFTGWTSEVLALDDETPHFSMTGLRGIEVVVKDITPDTERYGLKNDQIKTEVNLRLREAGIKVPTGSEIFAIPDFALLIINVDLEKNKALDPYNYSIEVELYKHVILNPHDKARVVEYDQIKVWSSGLTASIPGSDLKSSIQNDVIYLVDKMINAYLGANPNIKKD